MFDKTETQTHDSIYTDSIAPNRIHTDSIQTDSIAPNRIPEVLTADELALLLRVNRKTVYKSFKAGEIPGGRHVGGAIRFSRDRVLQWLADGQGCGSRSPGGGR
jgi:excisionase family DNA binding protein